MIKNSFSYGKIRNIVLVGDASPKQQQWRKKILQRFTFGSNISTKLQTL